MRAKTRGFPAILCVGLLAVFGTIATAQQPSSTRITSTGQPQSTTSTRLVNATVVSVDGNNVVAEDASGHATQYTIPDGFKFQFEGRDIGVSELKPGMHVSATVTTTTTTTPVFVTEIKTGKVLVVSGHSIIVRGPQGQDHRLLEQGCGATRRHGHAQRAEGLFERPAGRRQLHRRDRQRRGAEDRHRERGSGHGARGAGAGQRSGPHGGRGRRTRGGPHGSRRRRTRFRPDGDLPFRSRRDSRGSPRDGLIHGHRSRPGDDRDAETVSDLAPDRPGRRDPARRVSPPAPPRSPDGSLLESPCRRPSGPAATAAANWGRIPPSMARWRIESGSRPHLRIRGLLPFGRPGAQAHFPA